MKKSISDTFKNIRKLPLEVNFIQVEKWVQQHEFKRKRTAIQPFYHLKKWVYQFSKN